MATIKENSTIKSKTNPSSSNGKSNNNPSKGMKSSELMKLFEDELKDIYWAEKALTKALPKMIKNARSKDLTEVLESHVSETEDHVGRLEEVFNVIGKKASAKKCDAIAGLIKEAEDIMEDCEDGSMRDAGIISADQKVEHYAAEKKAK